MRLVPFLVNQILVDKEEMLLFFYSNIDDVILLIRWTTIHLFQMLTIVSIYLLKVS